MYLMEESTFEIVNFKSFLPCSNTVLGWGGVLWLMTNNTTNICILLCSFLKLIDLIILEQF